MKKVVSYFFSGYNLSFQTLRFKQMLYLFIVLKIGYWLCYYDLYFGQNSIAYIRPYSLGPLKDLAFLLYNYQGTKLGYVFIFGTLISLALSYFLKKIPIVFESILWLLVINIHNKIYPTLTGGDLLLNQFLFFNCFFSKSYNTNLSWQHEMSKGLHNFGVIAIIIQIQLVYLLAGLAKLYNNDWLNGSAIAQLNLVNYFNLYSGPPVTNTFLSHFLNYLVLFYQLLFRV